MSQQTKEYALEVTLNLPYKQALEKVIEALRVEGFGVLTEVDVKQTLQEKLGEDFRNYTILGVCNPPLAHRALSADLDVGLLLPCNVVVYEEDEGTKVGIMDPLSMLGIIQQPELVEVAGEARARLERVANSLAN